MDILTAIEHTAVATWVRESNTLFAFTGLLFLHAVGLAVAAGVSAAIDLRILGVAAGLPLAAMEKLFPVIWVGFWINVVSGVLLLMANATQDLINPVFYTKMLFIALAVVSVLAIRTRVFAQVATPDPPGPRTHAHAEAFRATHAEGARVAVLDPPVAVSETTPAPTLVLPARAKILAVASLAFWGGALVAGRLTEYPSLFNLDEWGLR